MAADLCAFQRGWLRALGGDAEAGIEEMLQSAKAAPAAVLNPVVWTLLAEQQMEAQHLDAAQVSLETALQHCRQSGFYEAEVIRCGGELALRQRPIRTDEAEAAFRQATVMAAKQSCRALELRAATSLARLLRRTDRTTEARDVLAPVYTRFSEGFGRPDLKEAKDLLSQLT